MSQSHRAPRYYHRGPLSRAVEGMLHYGGGVGQRSWLIHRISGLGILVYLVAHITDTFFVVVDPAMYDHALKLYGGELGAHYYWPIRWAFRLGELGLIACVLFHSLNGLRIVAFDFWPRMADQSDRIYRLVVLVFWAIMIPVALWVVWPLASPPVGARPAPRVSSPAAAAAERPGPAVAGRPAGRVAHGTTGL